jgi:hypothetical protein
MPPEKNEKQIEWVCRILLTIHIWLTASGNISFLQAKRQLDLTTDSRKSDLANYSAQFLYSFSFDMFIHYFSLVIFL